MDARQWLPLKAQSSPNSSTVYNSNSFILVLQAPKCPLCTVRPSRAACPCGLSRMQLLRTANEVVHRETQLQDHLHEQCCLPWDCNVVRSWIYSGVSCWSYEIYYPTKELRWSLQVGIALRPPLAPLLSVPNSRMLRLYQRTRRLPAQREGPLILHHQGDMAVSTNLGPFEGVWAPVGLI